MDAVYLERPETFPNRVESGRFPESISEKELPLARCVRMLFLVHRTSRKREKSQKTVKTPPEVTNSPRMHVWIYLPTFGCLVNVGR